MERMWETIKKGLQDSAVTAINKAEDLTRLGHARLDIAAVKNKINQLQIELGAEVYRQFKAGEEGDLGRDERVGKLCECIGDLKDELQQKEGALEELRTELAEPRMSEAPPEPEVPSQD